MSSTRLYIGTMGFVYPLPEQLFYPANIADDAKLKYYSSIFNMVYITSTFFGHLGDHIYQGWLSQIEDNPSFKFVIAAPRYFVAYKNIKMAKSTWSLFWRGFDGDSGGCSLLHAAKRLGCIILDFPTSFCFCDKALKRLDSLRKILPADVKFGLEFKNESWWVVGAREKLRAYFATRPNWCMVKPYLENRLVNAGWAGTMMSTTPAKALPDITSNSNFTVMNLYGVTGEFSGSYSEKLMETIVEGVAGGDREVFCIYNNGMSSISRPLPPNEVRGFLLWPSIRELPVYTKKDLPASVHNAMRTRELWDMRGVKVGGDGFVEVEF